jgi:molecular chaperone GrpE
MTFDQKDQNEESGSRLRGEDPESVEDFIKELEAKEKDLHISSEMVIEVEDADFDDMNIPDFILDELKSSGPAKNKHTAKVAAYKPDPRVEGLQKEVTELKQRVTSLISERADLREKSLKSLREFENVKNRMERERTDTFTKQLENLATKMLPVLDNLDRALDFSSSVGDDKQDLKHFLDGIVLVNQQLNDIFAGMGVRPIQAVGEEFDPHFHEAVATVETDEHDPQTVTEELLRGYQIGSRVIRHSMVKVAKSPAPKTLTSETGSEELPTETDEETE